MEENEILSKSWDAREAEKLELEAERARRRKKEEELELARGTVDQLLQANAVLRRDREFFEDRVSAIETSLGWLFILRVRSLRARIFRPGTKLERCWVLFSRFIKTARSAGTHVALRKARERVIRKLHSYRSGRSASGGRFLARVIPQNVPVDRFRELPWKFVGRDPSGGRRTAGYFKILLISHSACRTGAPLCLLRLAEELTRLLDVECWVVLKQGGELADSFAHLAPTLEVEWLVAQGVHRHDVPRVIATAFHEFSSRGVAVCNTLAVSEFHTAFAEQKVEVLSWIHELPTFIALLGGERAIEAIKLASRKIIVPSQVVLAALTSRFDIDRDRIRTVYNGQDPRTKGLDRETLRLEIRHELGLPRDAKIVLGCGTVDLRKGSDLFVNVARRVLLDPANAGECSKVYFIWVGHRGDDNFRRWLLHDASIDGLGDRVRFIGPRSVVAPYYMAADLLALTSREDPCPLVNMEAMESGLAVVAFDGAGGAPEVLEDAGVCVPYLDSGAMAIAVRRLLADADLRHELGRRGRARIRRRFTWARFMEEFLDILQTEFHYRPSQTLKVSVIVPNYRHARYLEERLQSIFDQTLRPHEIIFLDDASPDDSLVVARRLARRAPVPVRVVVNEQNSGNTFRQWLKGLSLATGDLIWFAESDDSPHPLFLERLVPEFYDPEVVLAYCQSALVGPGGERLADDFLAHTDDISTDRWRGRFSADSAVEAELALSQKNTIPNASGVVFRRPQSLDFADELMTLKFAGDWFFYAMLVRGGKVNFLPEVLNFYRRHEATVSHRSVREDTQAQESLYVKARVFESYPVTCKAITGSLARSVLEYEQLTERMKLDRPSLSANVRLAAVIGRIRDEFASRLSDSKALRIVVVLGDLHATAETLAMIDLANSLVSEHTVFVCNAQPHLFDPGAGARLDFRVIPLEGTLGPAPWTAEGAPGGAVGFGEPRRRAIVLRELIRILCIDVVHAPSPPADRLMLEALEEPKILGLTHPLGREPDWAEGAPTLAVLRRRPA